MRHVGFLLLDDERVDGCLEAGLLAALIVPDSSGERSGRDDEDDEGDHQGPDGESAAVALGRVGLWERVHGYVGVFVFGSWLTDKRNRGGP